LAADAVVGNGHHDQRNPVSILLLQQSFQFLRIHVALEWMLPLRIMGLLDDQIHRHSLTVQHIGSSGVKVGVVGHHITRPYSHGEQQMLSRTPLMRGEDVFKAKDRANRFYKMVIVFTAGVGFIAQHDSGPLVIAHGRRAAVGEQVHIDAFSGQTKDIEAGFPDQPIALLTGGFPDRLDDFDAKRFWGKAHGASELNTWRPDATPAAASGVRAAVRLISAAVISAAQNS